MIPINISFDKDGLSMSSDVFKYISPPIIDKEKDLVEIKVSSLSKIKGSEVKVINKNQFSIEI